MLALLFLFLAPLAAWTLFDDFESRKWDNPWWTDDWIRKSPLVYGSFHGQNCVKVNGSTADPLRGYHYIQTDFFADENWSDVSEIKLDIYTEAETLGAKAYFEPYAQNDTPCVNSLSSFTLSSTGTWVTYAWHYSITASSPVARIGLKFDSLGANAATFYVDNLRLVLNNGTTRYWDDFDDQSLKWVAAGSTAVWNAAPEQITHNASTSPANGGAGCLWWNYTGPDYAQLMPSGVNVDWRDKNVLRADVRCTTTTIPITFYFWYDSEWGEEAPPRYVAQADTWQTLYWDLPPGTTCNNILGLNPRVKPDALKPSGTFYVDNIYVGQTRITVVKSTDAALARPGDGITYTLTYGNTGDDDATNLSITDVVPFNGVLSAEPGKGDAAGVEYYVGSGWTPTYDAAATKIRWRDDLVAAGVGGRRVSYTIKPK